MRKLFLLVIAVLAMAACTSKWEYKIVSVENEATSEFKYTDINVSSEDLNLFGDEGWDLVDVYTIIDTDHPNFGDSKYVTGIRENTRTSSVNFVFKRRK